MEIQNKYVKIIDDGEVYPTFRLDDTHTKNKEIQSKAIETEWVKTGFKPEYGMIGEIVEEFKDTYQDFNSITNKSTERTRTHYILKIYVLKNRETYYVNISPSGVEFADKFVVAEDLSKDALGELRRYKEKLDLELITKEEYDKIKEELRRFIL